MGNTKADEIESWLSQYGTTDTGLTNFVHLCIAQRGAQSKQLSLLIEQIANEDRCATIHEWIDAARRASEKNGLPLDALKHTELAAFRETLRQMQAELYPWRNNDLESTRQEYLEGAEEAIPTKWDDD